MSTPSTQPAETHAAEAHAAPHGPGVPLYVGIGIVLAVVTVFEVFAPGLLSDGLHLRPPLSVVLTLLGLAFVKAGLVAAFYMHLRYDSRVYTTVMVLASIVVTYFLWLLTFNEAIHFQLFR